MDKKRREKVKEALRNLDDEPVPVPSEGKPKEASKEPTAEDLKAQVEQLRMENQQLKMRIQALSQANQKGQQLLQYTIERFYDDEVAREHEHAMRQVAAMRQAQKPEE